MPSGRRTRRRDRSPPVATRWESTSTPAARVASLRHPPRGAVADRGPVRTAGTTLRHRARPNARRLVLLEGVDNPANVGAIVRNAAGFGWDGLVLDHTSADPLARRALRVAMGTAFAVPHARTAASLPISRAACGRVLQSGVDTGGTTRFSRETAPDRRRTVRHPRRERTGRSEHEALAAVDIRATIPMPSGVDSLKPRQRLRSPAT